MREITFNDNKPNLSPHSAKVGQYCICDLEAHLNSIAAAYDMLDFLRSSTNKFSYHEEVHSSAFYRGLSQCLAAVQEKLEQGLSGNIRP